MSKKLKQSGNTVYNIVQGIHQAAFNGKDHPSGGSKTGVLKHEIGDPIIDSRVIDGFAVKVSGNILKVTYSATVQLETALEKQVEENYLKMVEDITSFLKKEYKSITGETLTLKSVGEGTVSFQNVSNVKTFVFASKEYEVSGLESGSNEEGSKESAKKVEKVDKLAEALNIDRFKKML